MKYKIVILFVVILATFGALYNYFSSKTYYCKIPLSFDENQIPSIEIDIQGKPHRVVIDLGSWKSLELTSEVLEKLKTRKHTINWYRDRKGNVRDSVSYIISEVKIGDILFEELPAIELPQHCESYSPDKPVGYIGRFFLRKFKVLFNFPEESMIITNDPQRLKKEGFFIEKMTKIPLSEDHRLLFQVETALGMNTFRFTTASSLIQLKSKYFQGLPSFTTPHFTIKDHDFGAVTINACELSTSHLDGYIGMNFLKDHILYIDASSKVAYIG